MVTTIGKRIEEVVVKKSKKKEQKNNMPDILSPEGMMILVWAMILDALGILSAILILLFGVGLVFSFVVDAVGIFTIGIWSWKKMGTIPAKRRFFRKLKRFFLKKAGRAALVELTPVIGDFIPMWTIYVFMDLKK